MYRYLKKVISKKTLKNYIFVVILKATDKEQDPDPLCTKLSRIRNPARNICIF
jgi:hypothetical protein